jgi:hypothetical protein
MLSNVAAEAMRLRGVEDHKIPSRLAVRLERLEPQHVVVKLLVPDRHQRHACLIERADVLLDDFFQPFRKVVERKFSWE